MGRTFQSLRHRNYRLFFFGQLVSNTGNWLTTVALTLLVLQLTGSGLAVGLMTIKASCPAPISRNIPNPNCVRLRQYNASVPPSTPVFDPPGWPVCGWVPAW